MREIPLGRSGRVALIDDEDFGRVSSAGRWQFNMLGRNSHGVAYCYAQRKVPNGKGGTRTVMLHRFILDALAESYRTRPPSRHIPLVSDRRLLGLAPGLTVY